MGLREERFGICSWRVKLAIVRGIRRGGQRLIAAGRLPVEAGPFARRRLHPAELDYEWENRLFLCIDLPAVAASPARSESTTGWCGRTPGRPGDRPGGRG